jgi:hypothetical protein
MLKREPDGHESRYNENATAPPKAAGLNIGSAMTYKVWPEQVLEA